MIYYIDPQSYRNLSIYDFNLLSNMGGELTYICSELYDHEKMPDNIKMKRHFSYSKRKRRLTKALSYVFACIRLFFYFLMHKPKLIHIQWFRIEKFDYWFYKLVKCCFNTKIVFTAHNILPHNSGDKFVGIYAKLYRFIDVIVVHTEDTKNKIVEKFGIDESKIHIIPHGLLKLGIDKRELSGHEQEWEKKYDLKDKFVFTSLGLQTYYKGTDLIADAWVNTPELRNNNKCKLLVVGKYRAVDLSSLENIDNVVAEDRRISNEEFYFLLKHTDVYLLPYRLISQSGALLTVLSERVPVLVSDQGGMTEPLKFGKIGCVLKDISAEALRDDMLYLFQHPEIVDEMKNNKKVWDEIENAYDWKNISKTTYLLYDRMLNNNSAL